MAIQSARIRVLNEAEPRAGARYVLYWMQQSQRARFNPALELAIEEANGTRPAGSGLLRSDGRLPGGQRPPLRFHAGGSGRVARALNSAASRFAIRRGAPDAVALDLPRDAALVVCDRGYLKPQKRGTRA